MAITSLLPPENATGNFVKVVQRVPLKILLDDADTYPHLFGPGMSVEATVTIHMPPSVPNLKFALSGEAQLRATRSLFSVAC